MRSLHEAVVRAIAAVAGLTAGVLSAAGLAMAAIAGPIVGLAAVLATPVRALLDRLRGRPSAGPGT